MTRNQFRKKWLKQHRSYERRAFRILQNAFRRAARNIPFENLQIDNYEQLIKLNIDKDVFADAYERLYFVIGIENGRWSGNMINEDLKRFDNDIFTRGFRRELIAWLRVNAGQRITSVRSGFITFILDILEEGIATGKAIPEISREIQNLIGSSSFYRWQAMRIARTESTAAANWGAIQSGSGTGLVLDKVWISSNNERTRRTPPDKFDHLVMDGIKTEQEGFFDVQGDNLEFPGDPRGQAGNIINCRCAVSLVPRRDANGRLIRRMI